MKKEVIEGLMSDEDFKEWKKYILKTVFELFEKDKGIEPAVIFVTPDPEKKKKYLTGFMPTGMFMVSNEGKEVLSMVVKKLCTEKPIVALAFISEAWMGSHQGQSKEEIKNMPPPSEDPDRKEIVMINFETPFSCEHQIYDIIREEGKGPSIDKKSKVETAGIEGRFAHLLAKKIKAQA